MAKKKRTKATAEEFIKAVMGAHSMAEVAEALGCTRQAVSKRLRSYKEQGVTGLPDWDARGLEIEDVQKLVNQYGGADGRRSGDSTGLVQHAGHSRHVKVARKYRTGGGRGKRPA